MGNYKIRSKSSYGNLIRRARTVQARRSDHAKAIDMALKSPKAKDVQQWLSAPNRFDLPKVDTNKPQKNQLKSMAVIKEYYWENDNANKIFDRLVNKDNVDFSIPENKKAFQKIIATLEKNKIPYYIGENYEDLLNLGVQVLRKDLDRASELTDKYQDIMYKSVQ